MFALRHRKKGEKKWQYIMDDDGAVYVYTGPEAIEHADFFRSGGGVEVRIVPIHRVRKGLTFKAIS